MTATPSAAARELARLHVQHTEACWARYGPDCICNRDARVLALAADFDAFAAERVREALAMIERVASRYERESMENGSVEVGNDGSADDCKGDALGYMRHRPHGTPLDQFCRMIENAQPPYLTGKLFQEDSHA